MKVKLDIEIKCPVCGAEHTIDWQITRMHKDNNVLVVDTICSVCGIHRQYIEML
jgi:C4-type Zn-finger protein